MSKYNLDIMTVSEALAIPEIVKIVEKYFPGASRHPLIFFVRRKTLIEVLSMTKGKDDKEKIKRIREEVNLL